jgi:hypothetical protein
MITKKVNLAIVWSGRILKFIIAIYLACLLAKFVWWVISPIKGDVYVERADFKQFEDSAKFVVNRYPFGIVTTPPKAATPPIAEQIKLTGIYLNPPSNSWAFVEYNRKPLFLKIGDEIADDAHISAINTDSIVITQLGASVVVKITNESPASTASKSRNFRDSDSLDSKDDYFGRSNYDDSMHRMRRRDLTHDGEDSE